MEITDEIIRLVQSEVKYMTRFAVAKDYREDLEHDAYLLIAEVSIPDEEVSNAYLRTILRRRIPAILRGYMTPVYLPEYLRASRSERHIDGGWSPGVQRGLNQIFADLANPLKADDHVTEVTDFIEDDNAVDAEAEYEKLEYIEKKLASLTEEEYRLIDRVYGLTRNAESLTAIGLEENVTREAIRQRVQKIIKGKLR